VLKLIKCIFPIRFGPTKKEPLNAVKEIYVEELYEADFELAYKLVPPFMELTF